MRKDVDDLEVSLYDAVFPENANLDRNETIFLRTAALFTFSRAGGGFMKTHCANKVYKGVELIPSALTKGAIYIVRDPRDVALSFANHLGQGVDATIWEMGTSQLFWKQNRPQYLGSWSENVESWLSDSFPILVVRYEDMLSGEAFSKIAKQVCGGVDQKRLKRAVKATQFSKIKKQEQKHGFNEKPEESTAFFRSGGSTWRETLTKDQIRRIEDTHGDMMQKFGYEEF